MSEPTPKAADVLVIFGITEDLAKKMTFRALYRLEAAERLDCPIIGVAKEPWSEDDLRGRARAALEATGEPVKDDIFDRLAGRLGYVHGDLADPATDKVPVNALESFTRPLFYLEIPPALFAPVVPFRLFLPTCALAARCCQDVMPLLQN